MSLVRGKTYKSGFLEVNMQPITKKNKIIILIISIVLFVLVGVSLYLIIIAETEDVEGDEYVYFIIDGDTFQMKSGEKVRLLCVDTPEQGVEGYERASMFLESLILSKQVRLEFGKTLNQTDKYDRTLAFVYVNNLGKDVFINKLIIESGFSDVYEYGDEEGECRDMMELGAF